MTTTTNQSLSTTNQLNAIIQQQDKGIDQMNNTFAQYFFDNRWQREDAQRYYSYLSDSLLYLMEMQSSVERLINCYKKEGAV